MSERFYYSQNKNRSTPKKRVGQA